MKTTENRVNTRNTFVFSACISCVTAIMDFEMVQRMNVDELKKFLRLRGMKVSGKKAELVARVFCAYENDVQPTKTAQEVERELGNEYQAKLVIDDNCIPDPFALLFLSSAIMLVVVQMMVCCDIPKQHLSMDQIFFVFYLGEGDEKYLFLGWLSSCHNPVVKLDLGFQQLEFHPQNVCCKHDHLMRVST